MGLSRSVGITKAWVLGLQLVQVPASGWDFLSHSVGLGELHRKPGILQHLTKEYGVVLQLLNQFWERNVRMLGVNIGIF